MNRPLNVKFVLMDNINRSEVTRHRHPGQILCERAVKCVARNFISSLGNFLRTDSAVIIQIGSIKFRSNIVTSPL
jgi:hypothetical protein